MLPDRSIDEPRFTYGDYVQWQGDERWELINGVPFAMSPAPSRAHQDVVGQLFLQIASALQSTRSCRAYVAPFDVRLSAMDEKDDDVTTVVQPDISVICDAKKLDDAGCRGAPDWIIEVLSPATAVRDQVQKRDLYGAHGVREYWLVDPQARLLTVYVREDAADGFGRPTVAAADGSTIPAVFPEIPVDWSQVFE